MSEEIIEINCSARTMTRRALTEDEEKARANEREKVAKERKLNDQRELRARANLEKIANAAGISVSELKEALKDA